MFYVVLLAMVAAFLALRLYSVLGKRTGHEQQPLPRAADDRAATAVPVVARPVDAAADTREPVGRNIEPQAEAGLRAIIGAEPGFDVQQFLGGAQAAYRMTLEAFWSGDEASLSELAQPDVAHAFGEAIAARREAGETLENRLISIERAVITDAALDGREGRITVRFDADIAAVTRDAEGQVVAGSLTDAVETHDLWTFSRTLKSRDPNWKLADTDEV
ncbi:Tim44/TimA family putative adaptor protein [uncultured Sphingomonas sp.]|uniref:Tim44/TimA family putative adaptor protein n=1 Tax=uncultured Sphingomonas sp. TaxID=158754 RepID=UPI0025F440B3|nr:Tim44/TimA family putative adaptor protein [uncultured Sphingomonas sp.]